MNTGGDLVETLMLTGACEAVSYDSPMSILWGDIQDICRCRMSDANDFIAFDKSRFQKMLYAVRPHSRGFDGTSSISLHSHVNQ